MKKPSYKHAISFIALNDAPADRSDFDELLGYISVVLVSEIFDVTPEKVANDVLSYRNKNRQGS